MTSPLLPSLESPPHPTHHLHHTSPSSSPLSPPSPPSTLHHLTSRRDTDEDGTVSKKEFRRALPLLGLSAEKASADALYDSFDPDRSGSIDYKELAKVLKRTAVLPPAEQFFGMDEAAKEPKKKKKKPKEEESSSKGTKKALKGGKSKGLLAGGVASMESDDVQTALRDALTKNAARVIDLFRDWCAAFTHSMIAITHSITHTHPLIYPLLLTPHQSTHLQSHRPCLPQKVKWKPRIALLKI